MKLCIYKILFFTCGICAFTNSYSQIIYKGFIGENAIEMIIRVCANNEISGSYSYDIHKAPLKIKGQLPGSSLKGLKNMIEINDNGNIISTFEITKHRDDDEFNGTWTCMSDKKELHFSIQKDIVVSADGIFGGMELGQSESLPDKYFKLILKTDSSNFSTFVEKVKVIDKKTDRVVQEISGLSCTLMYFDNVTVFDYNFDGNMDFSIFAAYNGSLKTQRLYFLYNAKTKIYDQVNIIENKINPLSDPKQKTEMSVNNIYKN